MKMTNLFNTSLRIRFNINPYPKLFNLYKCFSTSLSCFDSNPLTLPGFSTYAKKTYLNPLEQRNEIFSDTKGKSGVYCWVNLINGKYYIGSGNVLSSRLSDYYQDWYYQTKGNVLIVRAILKYGMGNFALLILDFTEKENTLTREQYWINELKPEYNILSQANNSLGYKHTPESIELIRQKEPPLGRIHSEEVRKAMSESRKGENNSFFGKNHSAETKAKFKEIALNRTKLPRPGFSVEVLDLKTNQTVIYESIRDAAKALDTHLSTLHRREKNGINKPFRNRYVITINR